MPKDKKSKEKDIKILSAVTEIELTTAIDEFLDTTEVKKMKIEYQAQPGFFSVLIVYEAK